ncbi:hypothetical protein Q9L58_008739 [Maublancomyces gigas]|uniref:Uncharacterized protein n=1 Tax=Discina gigas TaxID=1032678 RepID=A0ABR3G995_9PEZI
MNLKNRTKMNSRYRIYHHHSSTNKGTDTLDPITVFLRIFCPSWLSEMDALIQRQLPRSETPPPPPRRMIRFLRRLFPSLKLRASTANKPHTALDSLDQLRSGLGHTAWKLAGAARAKALAGGAVCDLRTLECGVASGRMEFDPVMRAINQVLLMMEMEEPLLEAMVQSMMAALEYLGGNTGLEKGALVIGAQIVGVLADE